MAASAPRAAPTAMRNIARRSFHEAVNFRGLFPRPSVRLAAIQVYAELYREAIK
jgi:hypothetical protein